MTRTLLTSAIAVLAFTVVLGLAYPLAITGIVAVLPQRAVSLAADTHGNPRYFQPRPSQTDYNANATAFSNRGPNQKSAEFFYREQIAAYKRFNDGAEPPMDAVTTSGSGLDPLISETNAAIQARRVARVRRIPLGRVRALVRENSDGPGINTTTLNRALGR